VPLNKTNWTVPYDEYSPTNFTSAKNLDRNAGNWIDPDITHPDYEQITFNQEDKHFKCERKSHHGNYRFIAFQTDSDYLAPQNPVGRTGLIGRGHLGRWGPNHAADPIVTTY
jgi:ADP-ribose pyrophosphatase